MSDFVRAFETSSGRIIIKLGKQREGWAFSIKNADKEGLLGNGRYKIVGNEAKIDWIHIYRGNEKLLLPRKVSGCIIAFNKVEKVVGFRAKKKKVTTIAKKRRKISRVRKHG